MSIVTILLLLLMSVSTNDCLRISRGVNTSDQYLRCPPGLVYNLAQDECECNQDSRVRCNENGALLTFAACMTYEEDEGTFIAVCLSFGVHDRNVSERTFIQLPDNVTELNEYMCGAMNRNGIVCSECLEGFSPAITSFGFPCSNCTSTWYGVPLFLFLEFVPSTIFYVIVVTFGFSITSAPMTSYILYAQLAAHLFTVFTVLTAVVENEYGSGVINLIKVIASLYGIWNLDFLRYIIPPFCISPQLKLLHVFFLYYISAFYPLCLIGVTWICIELYSRNFKPITLVWKYARRCFHARREAVDSKGTTVDVFATFFLLSYTKLLYTSLYLLVFTNVTKNGLPYQASVGLNPSMEYFSKEHAPFAVVAILILMVFVITPVILLAFYPVRRIRSILEKCKLSGHSKAAINMFVEKFYSCYRDGLDGGKDMRSFAVLQFLLRLSVFMGTVLPSVLAYWFFHFLLFGSVSLLIAIIRPYKRSYMNAIDTLTLAALSLIGVLYILFVHLPAKISVPPTFFFTALCVIFTLPLFIFSVAITGKGIQIIIPSQWRVRLHKHDDTSDQVSENRLQDNHTSKNDGVTYTDVELPDRLLHPYRYVSENDETSSQQPGN